MANVQAAHPSGRLVSLEVENFKSYRGRHSIGPFYDFTAVIGPNGSGKSNIMDAISFVLGVKAKQLRGAHLKELVHSHMERQSSEEAPGRATVKLVFEGDQGTEMHFSRVILPSSSAADAAYQSQYRIDDKAVSWEAYNQRLESIGILVKAKNFLIFQGRVEEMAAMQPRDLTALFEHISGSDAYKRQYEELEAKKNEAEDRTALMFAKKKTLAAERKAKKEQKEEAEKHLAMHKELADLRIQFHLWQLYHVDQESAKLRHELAAQRDGMGEAAGALLELEKRIADKRKAAAALVKERQALEKRAAKRRADLDKKNPENVKAGEEAARLAKRIKAAEKGLEEGRRKLEEHAARVAKLQADMAAITAAQNALDAEAAAQREAGELHLDPALQAEWYHVQEEAGAKTSKMRADRAVLASQQSADGDEARAAADTEAGVAGRLVALTSDAERARSRCAEAEAEAGAVAAELAAKHQALERLADANRRNGAQRDHLAQKLEAAEGQLREAKADLHEDNRGREVANAVAALKRLFPGVKGRMTELARVPQRRYALAMSVVMGRDLDSVIVDTEATAKECIAWLKQNRMSRLTFYPIATVRAKPVNERLRALGGSSALALDLLDIEPGADRAYVAVCGNTLVCDTLDEARALAFRGPERHRVVTLEGTLIEKTGLMTGGFTRDIQQRARRWDDAALAKLKQERAALQEKLAGVPPAREAAAQEAQLRADADALQRRAAFLEADVAQCRERLAHAEAQVMALERERERRAPGSARLREDMAKRAARIAALDARIHEVEDRIFQAFGAKVGVDNIRERMAAGTEAAEAAARRRMELATHASKLKHNLNYEQRRDLSAPLAASEKALAADRQRLTVLQAQAAKAQAARDALEQELAGQAERCAELRAAAEAAEAELRALRKEAAAVQAAGGAARRQQAATEADLAALASRRAEILEAASMHEEGLPYLARPKRRAGRASRRRSAVAEDEEEEDAEEAEDMDVDRAGPLDEAAMESGEHGRRLDYGRLPREWVAAAGDDKARKALEEELRADLEERQAQLARVAPNLKAVDQYGAVKERERAQQEELEEARRAQRAAAEAFAGVRQARHDTFMSAYDHVAGAIDAIFKELTTSVTHPLGGTAMLSLEDAEAPYLGGVRFTAMPPTKRFRDMDLLSGGEKTVAALALLFAVHAHQPSPFFVLDEIDAALDAANVARVAAFLRAKTRPGLARRFQSIVISLKDTFYERADALVGVSRDVAHGASVTYTFDLTRFEAQAG